jgi:hypothetical protein
MERATWAYEEQLKNICNDCHAELKGIFTNPAVVGPSSARIAANGFASITDSPYVIQQRLEDELGALDAESEKRLKDWYPQNWTASVLAYITAEAEVDITLTPNGKAYTPDQRFQFMKSAFGYKASGIAAISNFDFTHPRPEDKTLANFHVHMLAQSANIMAGTVREQVYPGLAQAAAPIVSVIDIPSIVPVGSPAYAAWESLILLTNNLAIGAPQNPPAEAFAAEAPPRQQQQRRQQQGRSGGRFGGRSRDRQSHNHPIGRRYCWKHGFGTHPGDTCYGCAAGSTERWEKYDTRGGPVFDATRIIGHTNCRHFPPCISEANARAATGPHTFPATPGNESVFNG